MADETAEISRTDVAERLRTLADEFDGDGDVDVAVDNKTVTLHPPAQFTYEIETSERDGSVRSDKETLDLALRWEPDE
jgi:amphi-Trp domain-containing protein